MSQTAKSARVVKVAAGVEDTDQAAPVRDDRHQALAVLVGKWINEGRTIGAGEIPSVPILTSDVYEWAPGGFFILHSAFGTIGETTVGGVEIIGVAEAVVERGAVRLAVNADDLDAADGRFADLPEGRVHHEEPAGRPLIDIAGEDRNRRNLRGLDRVAFVGPLADEDRERLVAAITDRHCPVRVLNPSGDVDHASGPGGCRRHPNSFASVVNNYPTRESEPSPQARHPRADSPPQRARKTTPATTRQAARRPGGGPPGRSRCPARRCPGHGRPRPLRGRDEGP